MAHLRQVLLGAIDKSVDAEEDVLLSPEDERRASEIRAPQSPILAI